ncbi:unannotated protein [freshwater metagenome]|uniref:Unannotated protein n=1 Tax=freshwater metagenome TaxID=449393 RepID=A0A6J7JLA1_9ZZZZ|nr:hypothetical protein [Actinomycetota bacterium]
MAQRFPVLELEGPGSVALSLEERYATLENVFVHQFFQLYRILGERLGWETANEIAGEVPESSIALIVDGYARKFGLEGQGAELLSKVLQAEFQAEGADVRVSGECTEHAELEVLCPFGAMLQSGRYADVKIEDGLCDRGCAVWMDRVGATVEPPVRAERLAWMGDGASRCHYRLTAAAADGP